MSTSLTWNIITLERNNETGIVFNVHYELIGENNSINARNYGTCFLDPPDPYNVIPYEDLTKTMIIEWIKNKLGKQKVFNLESGVLTEIKNKENNNHGIGVPWSA